MDLSLDTTLEAHRISEHNEELPSMLTQNDTHKIPISDSSPLKPPDSSNYQITTKTTVKKEKTIKKNKMRSRSNSFNRSQNSNSDEQKKPIEKFISLNENLLISYLQFSYILENFKNKSINIHSFTEEVNIGILPLMDIINQIRPLVTDRSIKSRLTNLSNVLFQAQPTPNKHTYNIYKQLLFSTITPIIHRIQYDKYYTMEYERVLLKICRTPITY
jgi:hypothetical protein